MLPITKYNYAQKTHKGDNCHQLASQYRKFHLNIDHQQKHNLVSTNINKKKKKGRSIRTSMPRWALIVPELLPLKNGAMEA